MTAMQNLFTEFKKTNAADWKTRLIKDLKGEPIEQLIWKNENGFEIQPFYTSEDLTHNYTPAFTHSDWQIAVKARYATDKDINSQFLKDLAGGASSISLVCKDLDLAITLAEIQLNYIHTVFYVNEHNHAALYSYLNKNYTLGELNCTILPEAFSSVEQIHNWKKWMAVYSAHKNIRTMGVDLLATHNQNCFAYYEIAMLLSALNEYLNVDHSDDKKPLADFVIKTGVNSDYFIQIAKLRAIRRLWQMLKSEFQLQNELYVLVETSLTNKSISDSYNNLLRTTLESMAAVSGGCNELVVNGFDVLFEVNHNLSDRMAINQQLILKEESYLDKMADTACGSYYIESITDALAQKALETFKRFEKEGGYFKCLEKNIFSTDIKQQASQQQNALSNKERTVIGVTKFRNEKENIPLTDLQARELKKTGINNPILNFELESIFKK